MSFLKNRTVVGVICILLSLLICFGLTPLFNQSVSQKAEIVRVVQPIRAGDEITESMVQIVEVGGYNLPEDVLRQKESAVGKYATADLAVGDYIIPSKLSDAPAAENAYLYSLDGSQQAISVSIKSFAEGLSGKLQSGDIVSVIAPDYKQQGQTVVPAELQYVEIISVTASSGYTEMAEFGLLTKYIFGTGIEEINVNSWRDIEVLYANGETVKLEEHFDSPEHAVNVIRRMLHVSGMVLDNASPAVLGHLSKNIRIAVLKTPLVDEDVGVTASIRIVNPQNMQKEDFVKGGTATGPMLDFLAACLRYGVSVCVAGATGSGKTTVAGWLLTTIPDNKRIFTIENGSRELDLVREKDGRVCNSVIHTITRESENAKQNIDQDMLLDMALRYHPDIICVGEMRSAEAYAAQEAARTGHGVLTTIHSNSSQATWRRMVTLCKRKHEMADDTLMDLVTEAFPIVVFAKQLEDKSRKIMEIMECEILPTGERRYNTLYHFKIEENRLEDGKYRIKGRHEAVNPISESLQKRFIDNGMPQEVLTQLVGKKSAPSKGKSGSSPAKAGQATPAPKTRSAQSKPPAKPETGKEGGESV